MAPLPPLPDWISLEHDVARSSKTKNYMDGTLMSALHGNLSLLSDQNFDKLKNYFATAILLSQDRNSLLNEITDQQAMLKAARSRLKDTNPTSRDHISWIYRLTRTGSRPSTATGRNHRRNNPDGDRDTSSSSVPEMFGTNEETGDDIRRREPWLKLCTTASRIHHHCSVATSHRCAHESQTLDKSSDSDFRKLFMATPGMVMVGADLSG